MTVMAGRAGTAMIGGVLLANHLPLLAAVSVSSPRFSWGLCCLPCGRRRRHAARRPSPPSKCFWPSSSAPLRTWTASADLTGQAAFAAEQLASRSCPVVG